MGLVLMGFIVGKKCPHCQSGNFLALYNRSWPCHLPGVHYFTCVDCHQDFFYLFPLSITREKRNCQRTKAPPTLLARIRGHRPQFARIDDISLEGIGFSYDLDVQKFARDNFSIDLYDCNRGTYLENIPVQVVSSRVRIESIGGQPAAILRNGVRFKHLNNAQKKILENLIRDFQPGEQATA